MQDRMTTCQMGNSRSQSGSSSTSFRILLRQEPSCFHLVQIPFATPGPIDALTSHCNVSGENWNSEWFRISSLTFSDVCLMFFFPAYMLTWMVICHKFSSFRLVNVDLFFRHLPRSTCKKIPASPVTGCTGSAARPIRWSFGSSPWIPRTTALPSTPIAPQVGRPDGQETGQDGFENEKHRLKPVLKPIDNYKFEFNEFWFRVWIDRWGLSD